MNQTIERYVNDKQLNAYLKRMLEVNETINLTRVTDYDQAKILHLEDSLSALEEFEKSPDGDYGDLGAGCGFPGVALTIATGRNVVLIDSVKKKMAAVAGIVSELGLDKQISTNDSRIEELAVQRPNSFGVLTARALSSLPSLLELASPLLVDGGWLIALKAHVEEDELKRALGIEKMTGMKLVSEREFYLSDGETFRSVYVFEKVGEPGVKLPRRIGLAQRKPLG